MTIFLRFWIFILNVCYYVQGYHLRELLPCRRCSGYRSVTATHSAPTRHSSLLEDTLQKVKHVWGTRPNVAAFPGANFPLNHDHPILEIPNFLSPEECRFLRDWAFHAIENGADECDDYLNYRVNQEVDASGASKEGRALLADISVAQESLSAENKGGFRVRLDTKLIEDMLKTRILTLLDMPGRNFVFEEGQWIRPDPRSVVIRDQTVVLYRQGDGVPPHVDGKDGTLLVYLNDVREDAGGRTVFPEDGFAQTPVAGTALLYRSKHELLHYSEAMVGGTDKWIMQLLLDYNHSYQPGDTITCFRSGMSYIWDGSK